MKTHTDRLVLLIGNAGGEKRIKISKSKESEGRNVMIPVRIAQQLFIDDLASCVSEHYQKGDQYAIATLTDKGRARYETLKSPKIYK